LARTLMLLRKFQPLCCMRTTWIEAGEDESPADMR